MYGGHAVDYTVERDVLILRMTGHVSGRQILATLQTILDDPAIPAGLPSLVDLRETTGLPKRREVQEVRDFFHAHQDFFLPRRAALVRTLVQYGVARIAMALEEDRGMVMHVSRDETEALQFLRAR